MSMASKPLVFVTGNKHKLEEVKAILSDSSTGFAPIELKSQSLDIPEIQGSTEEVARAKCMRAAELVGGPVITEDVALCFDAYNGLPGPYIKHFLTNLGPEGLSAMLAGFPFDHGATAICTFALSLGPGETVEIFEGKTRGEIVEPRGPEDFGWDCTFEPDGTLKTYAEMSKDEKNMISHRRKALDLLRTRLQTLYDDSPSA